MDISGIKIEELKEVEIEKIDLFNKMEEYPDKFNFIKVIASNDKEAFIKKYLEILNKFSKQFKYFDRGFIPISTWLKIMNSINLRNNYCIYRNNYYGENTGQETITYESSDYKACVVEFGSVNLNRINLYIANKTIIKTSFIRRCNYTNQKQGFWDVIIN